MELVLFALSIVVGVLIAMALLKAIYGTCSPSAIAHRRAVKRHERAQKLQMYRDQFDAAVERDMKRKRR